MKNNNNKIRVLHVVRDITYGGVESFLKNYISRLDQKQYSLSLITYSPINPERKKDFEKLGFKIYQISTNNLHSRKNFFTLKKIIQEVNPDIIHSHLGISSYPALLVGKICSVQRRICHTHTSYAHQTIKQKISKFLSNLFSTHDIACSSTAAKTSFYGYKDATIIKNAIDLKKHTFDEKKRKTVRRELGVQNSDVIYGHIGRFDESKNHKFLIEVFARIKENNLKAKLLLIGDGKTKKECLKLIKEKGLNKSVIILKPQNDISRYYNAMDLFLFPSIREGLGMSLIEAQANGLPCIASENVPQDAIIIHTATQIPLKQIDSWVQAALHAKTDRAKNPTKVLEKNGYNINKQFNTLDKIYRNAEPTNLCKKISKNVKFNKIYNLLEKVIFNPYIIPIILLGYFGLPGLNYYAIAYNVLRILFSIASISILLWYVMSIINGQKISGIQAALLLYFTFLLISTFFGYHNYSMWFTKYILHWLTLSVYIETLIKHKKNGLFSLNILISVLIICNLITILLFPSGIVDLRITNKQKIYLLGYDNAATITIILGALYTIFYSKCINPKKRYLVLSIITNVAACASIIITWSATGVVSAFLLILANLIPRKHTKLSKLSKLFNLKNYVILALSLFLGIVVLRCQNIFSFIIESILHKNLTFTGRTRIWDASMDMISYRPISGIGINTNNVIYSKIGATHCHNIFLNIIFESGLLGLCGYLNIFYIIWLKIKDNLADYSVKLLSFGIFIYFIASLMEVYQFNQMFVILLVLLYYVPTHFLNRRKNLLKEKECE